MKLLALIPFLIGIGVVASEPQQVPINCDFYVAVNGTSAGTGSISSPWNLATGLAKTGLAGKTICLRDGVYKGIFKSILKGTVAAPVVVRSYPGEWAIIDSATSTAKGIAALDINGYDAWYRDFEVRDTNPVRATRYAGVRTFGPRTKLINLVVHDTYQGISAWTPAIDAEIYGNIIYNSGVLPAEQGDRAHGPNMYLQNGDGIKRITDNIIFNGIRLGVQAYTENGRIDNLHFEGNTFFNNGVPGPSDKVNLLHGGSVVALNPNYLNNYSYSSPGKAGTGISNYRDGCNGMTFNGNYLVAGTGNTLTFKCTNVVSMAGNSFYGSISGFTQSQYPNNVYGSRPASGVKVFVRPNKYEMGRANITVFNWSRSSTVSVDLSAAGLTNGQQFEIRNAQNYFAAPVLSGAYNAGSPVISLSMTGPEATAVAAPVALPTPATTLPEFGVFVVTTPMPEGRGLTAYVGKTSL